MTERFWSQVGIVGDDECWIWHGSRQSNGYGRYGKHKTPAHRFAYEDKRGPIPAGLQIDHLCRAPLCVNPSHLEPVTQRENILRGTSPSAVAATATHCKRGHPFDEANTYLTGGRRQRRACHRDRERERKRRARDLAWQEAADA